VIANKGQPIYEVLRPLDSHVVLKSRQSPPLVVSAESLAHFAQMMYRASVAIAIVRVTSISSRLTEDGDWITGRVRTSTERIIKGAERVGDFSFDVNAGELMMSGVRVTATIPWMRALSEGSRYLVFANLDDNGAVLVGPAGTYEIVAGDVLKAVFLRASGTYGFDGQTLSSVENLIKTAADY
jgi:hypothetical protein